MGKIGIIITIAAMAVCAAFASEPTATDPVALSFVPASLTLSTGDVVRATVRVSNISEHPVSFLWGESNVSLWQKTIVVDTHGGDREKCQKITLGAGGSRDMPIVVTQGREIPLLDAGEYLLDAMVYLANPFGQILDSKKAEVKITEKSGQAKDAPTVNRIVKLAREYSETNHREPLVKVDCDSYRISRENSENWSVEFSHSGPNIGGTETITVNAKSQRAFILPIPVTPR